MDFNVTISNVQHILNLEFNVDLSSNKVTGIVGLNGVGKTTLIRAIKNLQSSDTFLKTASPYIFNADSKIVYEYNDERYEFLFNEKLNVVDTKSIISKSVKDSLFVELPMPHGDRFNHFQKLGDIDEELRKCISISQYTRPDELINFLHMVYNSERFENLKEITIKKKKYYFILKEHNFYIREDYLSSGEYFIINLYKMIQSKRKCIFIDEIDISLDTSAQVNLVRLLAKFCTDYEVNILFTTHSLALMKMLDREDSDLFYMQNTSGNVSFERKSYNYLKSILFGFTGWDKYILTEDEVLESYLTHILPPHSSSISSKFKIIYIGGGANVVDLYKRNQVSEFFATNGNVICVLDGDQKGERYLRTVENIYFIPFLSIEKELGTQYRKEKSDLPRIDRDHDDKAIYKGLTRTNQMSSNRIFDYLNNTCSEDVADFTADILKFLNNFPKNPPL